MRRFLNLFRLSRTEYFADFVITPPLTAIMLFLSLRVGLSAIWMIEFIGGLLAWTFYEYVTHRWLLHRVWLFREMHALHHDNQRDYIALHPLGTLTIYASMWLLFGLNSTAAMVGFSVGYIAYSFLHTAFHYARIVEGNPLLGLKRHHALHHAFEDMNFGVSTKLWDRVFCTMKRRRS